VRRVGVALALGGFATLMIVLYHIADGWAVAGAVGFAALIASAGMFAR
jgi:hypothetical protein